jgi:hypothetical protein
MIKKVLLLAAGLVLAAATPASAGGWAVSTLDAPPGQLSAGEDHHIGFTIRQHGVTPVNMGADEGTVGIRMVSGSGQTFTFVAEQEGAVGHYVATVNVPSAGAWSWEVLQGWFEAQPLGAIDVTKGGPPAAVTGGQTPPADQTAQAATSSGVEGWRIAAVVVAGLLAVAFLAELVLGRRRHRGAAAPA